MVMRNRLLTCTRRAFNASARRSPVLKNRVTPENDVPTTIPLPPYAVKKPKRRRGISAQTVCSANAADHHSNGNQHNQGFKLLDEQQQRGLRRACQLAKEIRDFAVKQVCVGITTDEIDLLVHREILRFGAYPSVLNYGGFPKSLCTSVNEVVVHGIPDRRPLEDGDIVNLDVSVFLDGFHGDTSRTALVGNVDEAGRRLVEFTHRVVDETIAKCCKPNSLLTSIGEFIEDECEKAGFSVVREYLGHGIGTELHCPPQIMHYRNKYPGFMQPGMAFTIEPPVCEGSPEVLHWNDGYTAVTADGLRSAQAEHTILIVEDGAEVLT